VRGQSTEIGRNTGTEFRSHINDSILQLSFQLLQHLVKSSPDGFFSAQKHWGREWSMLIPPLQYCWVGVGLDTPSCISLVSMYLAVVIGVLIGNCWSSKCNKSISIMSVFGQKSRRNDSIANLWFHLWHTLRIQAMEKHSTETVSYICVSKLTCNTDEQTNEILWGKCIH